MGSKATPFGRKVCSYMQKAGWKPASKELMDKIEFAIGNKKGWPPVAGPKEKELEAWKKYQEIKEMIS